MKHLDGVTRKINQSVTVCMSESSDCARVCAACFHLANLHVLLIRSDLSIVGEQMRRLQSCADWMESTDAASPFSPLFPWLSPLIPIPVCCCSRGSLGNSHSSTRHTLTAQGNKKGGRERGLGGDFSLLLWSKHSSTPSVLLSLLLLHSPY